MSDWPDRLAAALSERYRLERELGRGGMAVVYLAEDLKHGRQVAVKVLLPELAREMGPGRFLREIEIAARLSHPHILPLFDSGEAEGFLYYVMPFVEGESLRERLQRDGHLSLEQALKIVREVAGALSRAHERGVVHRDVKPANILFEADHALVADFGIARAVDAAGGERVTRTGMAIGTPSYMSPEQAVGDAVDARSDIYGLACIVFEMLAGRPPFAAPTPQAVLGSHVAADIPSIRALRPDLPPGLGRVLAKGLAKDPAERFRTATEFADALTRASTAQAIAAEERSRKRSRVVKSVAAAVAIFAAAAGGWWLTTALGGPRVERLAILPFANLGDDPEGEYAYLVQGVHEGLINELSRTGIPTIARQSVMRYASTNLSIREIAAELGVDGVMSGSLVPSDDSVGIMVRLTDARTEEPMWSADYTRELGDVLALYRQVARTIAGEIRQSLSPEQEARLAEAPRLDPRVVRAYMNGRFHAQRFTAEDLNTAIEYFAAALDIDSTYAPAYVGLARVWGFRAQAGLLTAREGRERVAPLLDKALELDPELAEAHHARAGMLVWNRWDLEGGTEAFQRVVELDPSSAEARVFYGHLLSILGRWDEAANHVETAMELDPHNPFIQGLYATQLTLARRYEEAIRVFEEMFRRNPGVGFGRQPLIAAYHLTGREADALASTRDGWIASRDTDLVEAFDSGHAEGGYPEAFGRAADALAARADTAYVAPVRVAQLYVMADRPEEAIDWLEIGYRQGEQNMPYIGVTPMFEGLHERPRFRDLARRTGVGVLKGPQGSD